MNVIWAKSAKTHLDGIYNYIALDSVYYAKNVIDRITSRSKQIAGMPFSGRKVPEFDDDQIREVIESPYRIIYRIKEERIEVVAVVHGARFLGGKISGAI